MLSDHTVASTTLEPRTGEVVPKAKPTHFRFEFWGRVKAFSKWLDNSWQGDLIGGFLIMFVLPFGLLILGELFAK